MVTKRQIKKGMVVLLLAGAGTCAVLFSCGKDQAKNRQISTDNLVSGKGQLSGRIAQSPEVKDQAAGVTVKVIGSEATAKSQSDGSFALKNIDPGTYKIEFYEGESLLTNVKDVAIKENETTVLPPIYTEELFKSAAVHFKAEPNSTVGNGADAIFCKNRFSKIMSVEVLDYYEARALRNRTIDLGDPNQPYQEKVMEVLNRLERLDKAFADQLKTANDHFIKSTTFLDDADLPEIDDSGNFVIRPRGCELKQLAILVESRPHDPGYFVANDLFKLLDNNNKATMVLHEIIYRQALKWGHTDSASTRYLVSIFISDMLPKIDKVEFYEIMRSAQVSILKEVMGIKYLAQTEEIYPSGAVKSVLPFEPTPLAMDSFKFTLLKDAQVSFYEAPQAIMSVSACFNGFSYPATGCQYSSRPEVIIKITPYCAFSAPHGPGSQITFYENGSVKKLKYELYPRSSNYLWGCLPILYWSNPPWSGINTLFNANIKNEIEFYENGMYKSIVFVERMLLESRKNGSILVLPGIRVEFDSAGYVTNL